MFMLMKEQEASTKIHFWNNGWSILGDPIQQLSWFLVNKQIKSNT